MAENPQYTPPDNKMKVDDQFHPPSAPPSTSVAAVDPIQIAGQGDPAIASELLGGAESKRPKVDSGADGDNHQKPLGQLYPSEFCNIQPTSITLSGNVSCKKIDIPKEKAFIIIGKEGLTIKHLQLQSGANIQVTGDNEADVSSHTRLVELTGTPEQISRAEQLILDVLEREEEHYKKMVELFYKVCNDPTEARKKLAIWNDVMSRGFSRSQEGYQPPESVGGLPPMQQPGDGSGQPPGYALYAAFSAQQSTAAATGCNQRPTPADNNQSLQQTDHNGFPLSYSEQQMKILSFFPRLRCLPPFFFHDMERRVGPAGYLDLICDPAVLGEVTIPAAAQDDELGSGYIAPLPAQSGYARPDQ